MTVEVACPGCGRTLPMQSEHLTRLVRCLSCRRLFVAVEDTEIPCPRCGSIVIMPHGDLDRKVSCLSCGFVFPCPYVTRRRRLWAFFAISIVATILIIRIAMTRI